MYKIYGICQGTFEVDSCVILPFVSNVPLKINFNSYLWCIKGRDTNILVDTGLNDEHAKKMLTTRYNGGQDYIRSSLRKLDIDPDLIKTVIVTHLHVDHFSACDLYPNATFYIQKRDFEFFTGPAAKFKFVKFASPDMLNMVNLERMGRIKFLDGDTEIAPGIRTVLIGGHTPGSQSVVVSTDKGDVVICGDALDLYKNLAEEVCGLAANMVEALLGMEKIKTLASSSDLIIPSHDPIIMERFPSQMNGIAEII
jgi:glyoxylase-like metal-dependent hydrolase (beta-lactamase superfamily II)